MKNFAKRSIAIMLLGFGSIALIQAQQSLSAAGGDASGSGGTASFTAGQMFYSTLTGTDGYSVTQGVQQPFEIFVETGIEKKGIELGCVVYPNPVTDHLILKIKDEMRTHLTYQLFDSKGQMIAMHKVTASETKISMSDLSKGTYFLRVTEDGKEVKTFKIIKH